MFGGFAKRWITRTSMKTRWVTRGPAEFTAGVTLGSVAVSAWAPWQVAAAVKAAARAERRLTEEARGTTLAGGREPEHVGSAPCVCSVRASAESPSTATMMCAKRMLAAESVRRATGIIITQAANFEHKDR